MSDQIDPVVEDNARRAELDNALEIGFDPNRPYKRWKHTEHVEVHRRTLMDHLITMFSEEIQKDYVVNSLVYNDGLWVVRLVKRGKV